MISDIEALLMKDVTSTIKMQGSFQLSFTTLLATTPTSLSRNLLKILSSRGVCNLLLRTKSVTYRFRNISKVLISILDL